jgi:hypothetical protein
MHGDRLSEVVMNFSGTPSTRARRLIGIVIAGTTFSFVGFTLLGLGRLVSGERNFTIVEVPLTGLAGAVLGLHLSLLVGVVLLVRRGQVSRWAAGLSAFAIVQVFVISLLAMIWPVEDSPLIEDVISGAYLGFIPATCVGLGAACLPRSHYREKASRNA